MSAPRSFQVLLIVGRTLTRAIPSDTPENAEVIARFLFEESGAQTFDRESEEVVDILVRENPQAEVGQ